MSRFAVLHRRYLSHNHFKPYNHLVAYRKEYTCRSSLYFVSIFHTDMQSSKLPEAYLPQRRLSINSCNFDRHLTNQNDQPIKPARSCPEQHTIPNEAFEMDRNYVPGFSSSHTPPTLLHNFGSTAEENIQAREFQLMLARVPINTREEAGRRIRDWVLGTWFEGEWEQQVRSVEQARPRATTTPRRRRRPYQRSWQI